MKKVIIPLAILIVLLIVFSSMGGVGYIKTKLIQDEVKQQMQNVTDAYTARDAELQSDIAKARQNAAKYQAEAKQAKSEADRAWNEVAVLEAKRAEIKPEFDVTKNREWLEKRYGLKTH
jgi:hypothetical protein